MTLFSSCPMSIALKVLGLSFGFLGLGKITLAKHPYTFKYAMLGAWPLHNS